MKMPWKKILIVGVPVVIVFTAFYFWYKSAQNKPMTVTNNPTTTPPLKPSPSKSNSSFPLQQGSNNSSVKALQTALGVTADGIFGPNTLAALQSQYKRSSVPDQNTLNAIVTASANGNGSGASAAAQSLYNQFQAGGLDIYINSDYFADQVSESTDGTLTSLGTGFQMNALQTYDNTVYTLDGVTDLGLLAMKVSSGPLVGEYTVDPAVVALVVHPVYNPIPTTDPASGLTTF